jgi:hypothetical protein
MIMEHKTSMASTRLSASAMPLVTAAFDCMLWWRWGSQDSAFLQKLGETSSRKAGASARAPAPARTGHYLLSSDQVVQVSAGNI